jgi:hypothetical protein
MGQFRKPVKTLIVNSEAQLAVTLIDGSPVVTGAEDKFSLAGFIDVLFNSTAPEIPTGAAKLVENSAIKTAASSAVAEQRTYTLSNPKINDLGYGYAGGGFIVVKLKVEDLSQEKVEYHNDGTDRRYQVEFTEDVEALTLRLAAAINADEYGDVTATVVGADGIRITANAVAKQVRLFSEGVTLTQTALTAGSTGKGTYDILKNLQWSNAMTGASEFDRREEYFPRKGGSYTEYFFTTITDVTYLGGDDVADNADKKSTSEYRLFINDNLVDLKEALELVLSL